MDRTVSAPVAGLLADLSDPESGVGTGSAAALVGAIAAGSLQGVARASVGSWSDAAGAAAQAEALAARLSALADENARTYREARAALAGELPADQQERRDFTLGRLLERAAAIPARIAAAAADVAELADGVAGHALDSRRPDARAAGGLAAAAADAGAQLVMVNLAEGADGPLAIEARASAARARRAADRAAVGATT